MQIISYVFSGAKQAGGAHPPTYFWHAPLLTTKCGEDTKKLFTLLGEQYFQRKKFKLWTQLASFQTTVNSQLFMPVIPWDAFNVRVFHLHWHSVPRNTLVTDCPKHRYTHLNHDMDSKTEYSYAVLILTFIFFLRNTQCNLHVCF